MPGVRLSVGVRIRRRFRLDPTEDQTQRLLAILNEHGARMCKCGHAIGWGDIAWNNGSTKAGTEHCDVEIECEACYVEIVHIQSWWPGIDDVDDILEVLSSEPWR